MAELLGRTKEVVQDACNRYASRAPKVVRTEGQVKLFDLDKMVAFFAWYDEAQKDVGEGGGRKPRTQLEIAESNLVLHEARVAKAVKRKAKLQADLVKAEKEEETALELVANDKRLIKHHKTVAGRKLRLSENS
jgi:hypothetical protein